MKRILIATLAVSLLPLGGAAAETFTEQLLRSDTQRHPDWSVLLMDLKMLEEGKDRGSCIEMTVNALSDEGRSQIFFAGTAFLPPRDIYDRQRDMQIYGPA